MKRLILLLLLKSVRGVQLILNEFYGNFSDSLENETVSSAAFTEARAKLSHTAFIELNQKAVVELFYKDKHPLFKGFRLLAIDGSKIALPNSKEIRRYFGVITNRNHKKTFGSYTGALISVLYDPLGKIVLDGQIAKRKSYEGDLAKKHLEHTKEGDILITDRGYSSYYWFALLLSLKRNFIARCTESFLKPVNEFFASDETDKIVTLRAPSGKINMAKKEGLPLEIKVRLVKVILSTGEVEVLATSLTDHKEFPHEDFKELYNLRWGVEGFYGLIKDRLELENFSGKTVESVKQDFFSTLFLTGIETILTEEATEKLKQRKEKSNGSNRWSKKGEGNRAEQKVNRAVSFSAIKNRAIELFYEEKDTDKLEAKLTALFLTKPISKQAHDRPREKITDSKKIIHRKQNKKSVF